MDELGIAKDTHGKNGRLCIQMSMRIAKAADQQALCDREHMWLGPSIQASRQQELIPTQYRRNTPIMAAKLLNSIGKLGVGVAIAGGVLNSALYNGKSLLKG